jgi:hypothetical protein
METNETNQNKEMNVVPFKNAPVEKLERVELAIPNIGLIINFVDENYPAIKLRLVKNYKEARESFPNWFNFNVDIRYNAKGCNFILIVHFQVALQDKARPEFFKSNTLDIEGVTGDSVEDIIEKLNDKYLINVDHKPESNTDGQDDND